MSIFNLKIQDMKNFYLNIFCPMNFIIQAPQEKIKPVGAFYSLTHIFEYLTNLKSKF